MAAITVAALGLLSMGLLGALLYYVAAPALWPLFGNFNDWHGEEVWPATIFAGMLWSVSFLVAGWLNKRQESLGRPRWRRRLSYLGVLWVGAVLVWLCVAGTTDVQTSPRDDASRVAELMTQVVPGTDQVADLL